MSDTQSIADAKAAAVKEALSVLDACVHYHSLPWLLKDAGARLLNLIDELEATEREHNAEHNRTPIESPWIRIFPIRRHSLNVSSNAASRPTRTL